MLSGTTSESYLYVVDANSRPWVAVGLTRKKKALLQSVHIIAVCNFFDCGSRNSRAFNFAVITKSYSAGNSRLPVLCIDEILGEFLRIRVGCSANDLRARLSPTK
jgi:hypothetical protein